MPGGPPSLPYQTMYAPPTYGGGYGQNQASNSQPSSFNPNGIPPQQQHPHPQLQHQHQQQPGQPQQLMYNSQQFAAGSPSPYGASAAGIGMAPNAGAMGMMQNNGMAQMAGPHAVSQYQTPYSGSAYGANNQVSAGHLPPNFMPTTNAPSFAMNSTNMNMAPQQMQYMQNMQRMQPPPPSSTPTQPGPRASPFAGSHSNTPPGSGTQQSQFSTPQNSIQAQQPTPNGKQASQATVVTPQTPNFPPGVQNGGGPGGNGMATPLSPGSEARERDRVTLLLEINRELLMEVMALQAAQVEAKKEESSPTVSSPEGSDKGKAEKSKAISGREYVECMRRLQANLAYLAAIADRSHKPSSQIPSHPAIMTAPPLVAKPAQSTSSTSSPSAEAKKEESDEKDHVNLLEDREKRIETLKSQYKQLQDLFPGVDTKKESITQSTNTPAKPQPGQTQKPTPGQGQAGDPNAVQKLQNDQLRQKMMQQAQAQAQAQALAQAQQNQMLGR